MSKSIIKRLPESVRNSVRSGIILFDLTRVVEELVFNSLDAAATKVSVFVGVSTCYVKVVDDGSGISRDGLELLGERYATSKLANVADIDVTGLTFGFCGEVLASLSDVSVLEILTRAYGRPNGYRKIIKGSKCLHLGIDDDRKDVGTTVIVRDLFYNQPVRRKYIQTSPKKVLHTVKECVHRIALVHPMVSFKVVDVESDDELLCSHSSASPMSRLMNSFGIEDSIFLHELSASDGVIKLSGYISGPCACFSTKTLTLSDINSRFVCKSPIHKLLNMLAAKYESLNQLVLNSTSQKGKRSRSQAYPTFLLNISCPRSLYDLTFEPSKTYAYFKDWEPILTFIKKAIQHIWTKEEPICSSGVDSLGKDRISMEECNVPFIEEDVFEEDFPRRSQLAKKKCKIQNHQEIDKNMGEHNNQSTEMEFVPHTDYSIELWDSSPGKINSSVNRTGGNCSWISNKRFLLSETSNSHKGKNLTSQWENEPAGTAFSFELEHNKDIMKPFLRSCSSRESLALDGDLFTSKDEVELSVHSPKVKEKQFLPGADGEDIQWLHSSSRNMWEVEILSVKKGRTSDIFLETSLKTFRSDSMLLTDENDLLSNSAAQIANSGSVPLSFTDEWCNLTSDALFQSPSRDLEIFPNEDTLEGTLRLSKRDNYRHLANTAEKLYGTCFDFISSSSLNENYNSSCISAGLHFEGYNDNNRNFCRFLERNNLESKFLQESSGLSIDSADRYFPDSSEERYRHERQKDQSRHHVIRERSKRSHSAPPFYKQRMKFMSLTCNQMANAGNPTMQTFTSPGIMHLEFCFHTSPAKQGLMTWLLTSAATAELKNLQPSHVCDEYMEDGFAANLDFDARPYAEKKPVLQKKELEQFKFPLPPSNGPVEGEELQNEEELEQFKFSHPPSLISRDIKDLTSCGTKWRVPFAETRSCNRSSDAHDQDNILNISAGFLHLSADSLIPQNANKNFLEKAKVLQQVDKKFIPVVAGRTLVLIDQHAADERIRLEELRAKVLSGDARTISYLDTEQEMILPEIGYQLLHNYAKQVKGWGWICNIHSQGSNSFKRSLSLLHRQPTVVTLVAVPCVLGVNLSDSDLQEFLQQLADTDGSSTIPPSVIRVLNSKACRGAIMFGDSLLPSECSLIVEELKQTTLCFQCAHGRPTSAPIVNLEALHEEIAKLQATLDDDSWHGLRQHEPSLERAAQRLSASRG
ncbi:hypothetical protein ACFE04_013465 [Oxalis oulophora]